MKTTIVGRLILQERMRKNISQNDLCYGVCNRTTLSRIENGEIMPSYTLACVLFTRLGKSVPNNLIPLRANERTLYNLDVQMSQMSDNRDIRREKNLKEYEKYLNKKNILEEQRYLLYLGIEKKKNTDCYEESFCIHEKALKLSQPDFSSNDDNIAKRLLGSTELALLKCMAHTEYYLEDYVQKSYKKEHAIKRALFLKNYMETHISNYVKNPIYSEILFFISSWTGLAGDFSKALMYSNECVDMKHNSIYLLSHSLYNVGYSLASMEQKEQARKTLNDSFVLVNMYDEFDEVEYYVKRTDEIFHFKPPLDSKTFL